MPCLVLDIATRVACPLLLLTRIFFEFPSFLRFVAVASPCLCRMRSVSETLPETFDISEPRVEFLADRV